MPAAVRRGAAGKGTGGEDQRHPMPGRKDEFVERLFGADQWRQRLAIVDIGGALLKGLLTTRFSDGDLVDTGRVVLVVRPGHDGFAGVGEHASEFVESAQVVVNVADGAQRLAKVNVGQRIYHFGHEGHIALDVEPPFQGLHVNEIGAGGARAKVRPAEANVNVMFGIPVAGEQGKTARGHLQRAPDQVRREAHAQTVHPGPRSFENVPRFFVMYFEASVL